MKVFFSKNSVLRCQNIGVAFALRWGGTIEFKSENIGSGADWIVVVATLSGLFFLGEKINTNFDAWKAISKKSTSLFKKTLPAFIDANGARLIAIEKILRNELS